MCMSINNVANTISGNSWDKLPLRVPPDLRGHVEKHKESHHNRNLFVNRVRRGPDLYSIQGLQASNFTKIR